MRDAQLNAQRAKVDRAAALRKLRRDQVDGLVVRARSPGVLQERLVKVGQQVGPGDLLAKVVDPTRLQAELRIPEARAREIALGQQARVDLRIAEVTGQVRRVDPAVQDGNVMVVIGFPTPLPEGARPDLSVDGNIVLQQLQNVLYLRLPAGARPNSRVSLFRLVRGSRRAERVQVELGEGSMSLVEARSTLQAGDQVVVSDTSEWASNDAFELK
jgi:HlyD family secretion protein